MSEQARLRNFGDADDETVYFEAGALEAQRLPVPAASMSDGVLVRRGNRLAGADAADYDPITQSLHLTGDVRYEDLTNQITSESAEFAYKDGQIRFDGAEFLLASGGSRGSADFLQIAESGRLTLGEVTYTTCPPDSNDWLLQAGNITLDTKEGVGTARNVKLRFQGVPILYSPYLSFPIGDARKSGVLTPTVGSAGRSGNEISLPFYWNIRENYDATISPRWLSDRGLQLRTEFRYLTERNRGNANVEFLTNDKLIGESRNLIAFDHQTLFDTGWRNNINFKEVSDSAYFEDLGGTLSLASLTHLDRNLRFDFFGDNWSFFGQVQDYQTLDDTLLPEDEPYQRLPQVRIAAWYPDQFLGLDFGFNSEVVNFGRDTGVTGWRYQGRPRVAMNVENPGWFIRPEVMLDYTRYDLKNLDPALEAGPSRTVPIASFDTGMILERTMRRSANLIQTFEPRLLYVHIPFRDQDSLPIFDTISPDLNLVQLYRKNRYLGLDRIGDTNSVNIGITSRVYNTSSGEELVTATIGQSRYLTEQLVTLPGVPVITAKSSDYIAEVRFLLFKHLNFDLGHQWGDQERGTTQSQARLQYRPRENKIVNLAYRFRRDSLEQGDISMSWPLTHQWNFVGRYNYSFKDKESLEQFFGLEYESCCWGIRMVSRRYLSTRDGTRDTSFGLQLVLKGMTSVGTAADKMLERGILGYSPDLD